ncbi:MAG TPA: hypothetical protein VG890_14860, partial [Puia sp.]|nr:hypothetical protein [Puia sp.]
MRSIFLFIALLVFTLAQGQETHSSTSGNKSSTSKQAKSSKKKKTKYATHYGTASFYADKFEGRLTANGEVFSQQKLSAACNIIP